MSMRTHRRIVIGHHLILHGYGHWLPNDPRGSGSEALREEKFADLGPIHHGRKAVQPPREELRRFYRDAGPRLEHSPIWFDDAKRQAIGDAFARIVEQRRYTVWACAILKNHAHLCVRRHRDDAVTIWRAFASEAAESLRLFADVADDHPVWSNRPYKVFLYDGGDVRRVMAYIEENPVKEALGAQRWAFVREYDGFPGGRIRTVRGAAADRSATKEIA